MKLPNALISSIYETGYVEDDKGKKIHNLRSAIPPDQGMTIYNLIYQTNAKNTLEVGLAYGLSGLFACQAHADLDDGGLHTAIDPKQGELYKSIGRLNIKRSDLDDRFRFFEAPSYAQLPQLLEQGERFDLIFIDGMHLFDFTLVDFFYCDLLLKPNGYIIFDGGQTDSIHNIWSCSKTFTSTVLGLLIDDGKISLDDKVARFEPLLENEYPDVTFRHFASMTSGYSAKGGSRWPDQTYADWSWTVYDPDTPYFAPGTAYAYWDEAQMTFGRALTQVLQQPMEAYLKEKVTNQIGMEWRWGTEKEVHGIPINNGCTGVMLNAKNLARWGWLFCNQGSWDGTQLISKNWVNQATAVQVPNSIPVGETDRDNVVGPGCYGFNWWVNGMKADGQWKLPGAPEDTYFASGFNNNKCFVIPSWKMVVIRMGEDVNLPEADKIYGNFLARLGKAVLES